MEKHPQDYIKAFPAAKAQFERYVILLPHKERREEINFRVEIIVGKEMLTDGVNTVRLGGKIEAIPLSGWGFTYYKVPSFGPSISTLMGVPAGLQQVKKLVTMPSITIPYNSRIPLVIYLPEGGKAHYRIWQASDITEQAPLG